MHVWKTSIQLGQQKLLKIYKYVYQQLNHDKKPLLMEKE